MTAATYKAAVEEARRKDRPEEEQALVNKWMNTGDPEAAAYHNRLRKERLELHQIRQKEQFHMLPVDWSDGEVDKAVCAHLYRDDFRTRWRGTYEDTSKQHTHLRSPLIFLG